jgi:hypothetical protein
VREQLADRQLADARPFADARPVADVRPVEVLAQRVGEVQQPLVAQPQHQHRREGLRDRPDPVLRVPVRLMPRHAAAGTRPHRTAVPYDRCHQRRCPGFGLRHGDPVEQGAARFREQLFVR